MEKVVKLISITLLVVFISGCGGGGGTGGTTVSGTVPNDNTNTNPPPTTVDPIEPTKPDTNTPQQVTSARGETPPLPVIITGD